MVTIKKTKDFKTTTFEVESRYFKGFYVDVVESEDDVMAYLFHKNNHLKMQMFGATKGSPAHKDFMASLGRETDYEIYKYIRENYSFEEEYQEWDAPCEEEE